jgi:hypothetical protein
LQELLLLPAVVEVVAVAEVWVKFSSSFTTPTSPPEPISTSIYRSLLGIAVQPKKLRWCGRRSDRVVAAVTRHTDHPTLLSPHLLLYSALHFSLFSPPLFLGRSFALRQGDTEEPFLAGVVWSVAKMTMEHGEDCCVKVAVHVRPLIGDEKLQGCKDCVAVVPGKPQVKTQFRFPPACLLQEIYFFFGPFSLPAAFGIYSPFFFFLFLACLQY